MQHLQPYSLFEATTNPNRFGLCVILNTRKQGVYESDPFAVCYSLSQPTMTLALRQLSQMLGNTIFDVLEIIETDYSPSSYGALQSQLMQKKEKKVREILRALGSAHTKDAFQNAMIDLGLELGNNGRLFEIYWALHPNPVSTKTLIAIGEDVEDIDNFQPAAYAFYVASETDDFIFSETPEDVERVNRVLFSNPPDVSHIKF